jgi:predicted DNA-binding WGR domain protein
LFVCLFSGLFLFPTSKFLAESDDGGKFLVYNRWGRVGIKGQDKLHGPYSSRESAIQEFEQKFLAKTKNAWSARKNFVFHPKSYVWLEMDYSSKEKESTVSFADSVPLVAFSIFLCNLVCSSSTNSSQYPLINELIPFLLSKGIFVLVFIFYRVDFSHFL